MSTIARKPKNQPETLVENQPPRVRFNWGYWDGAVNTAKGFTRPDGITRDNIVRHHFDPFYAQGYVAGCDAQDAGRTAKSDDPAWEEFMSDLTDPDLLFFAEVE